MQLFGKKKRIFGKATNITGNIFEKRKQIFGKAANIDMFKKKINFR